MLPDIDGYEVLRRLRQSRVATPILIVSGLGELDNKIKGLGFGADDYLTKPFDRRELIARIQAIVRRSKGHADQVIRTGKLAVNLDSRIAEVDGRPLHLTGKEYGILELLSLRKGTTLTKEMFLNHLYGGMDEPEPKIIDVFVCKLRKKLIKVDRRRELYRDRLGPRLYAARSGGGDGAARQGGGVQGRLRTVPPPCPAQCGGGEPSALSRSDPVRAFLRNLQMSPELDGEQSGVIADDRPRRQLRDRRGEQHRRLQFGRHPRLRSRAFHRQAIGQSEDVDHAAPGQAIDPEQDHVEQQAEGAGRQDLGPRGRPCQLDLTGMQQILGQTARLGGAETRVLARGAESVAEIAQARGGTLGAALGKRQSLFRHSSFFGYELETVIDRPQGADEVMAQPRGQQARHPQARHLGHRQLPFPPGFQRPSKGPVPVSTPPPLYTMERDICQPRNRISLR